MSCQNARFYFKFLLRNLLIIVNKFIKNIIRNKKFKKL
jgi:hypothetical protein